jgi:hypothetical protein
MGRTDGDINPGAREFANDRPARLALLLDRPVAILTNKLSAMPKGLSPVNWFDDFLYLPEVLYMLFFIWLICLPGKVQRGLLARRQVPEVIDRRRSLLLDTSR